MGRYSHFHGILEFVRTMDASDLHLLAQAMERMGRCDLTMSPDRKGLIYCSEKTYRMVEQINALIAEARKELPDFGLKGALAADTEFEPYLWFVKIGPDGSAYAEPTTRQEFLAFRRSVYPGGYKGYGLIDFDDTNPQFAKPQPG